MKAMNKLQETERRRGDILARLDLLTSRDRELSREIGAKVADGAKSPQKLRDERRDMRDEIEDLTAALPVLDREAEAARTAQAAEVQAEKQARLSAVKSQAADLGQELREAWEPRRWTRCTGPPAERLPAVEITPFASRWVSRSRSCGD